ncbi:hybrid sensor histidine kinase/response regulator transcription factor [Larkinella humicola]|uniref:hybrid sensor histidine kinase/response regulator transcription factor n=1 Tax=Larkinella humicola TaxID=2607654 RepID=UPI001782E368|nr:response regulator [Larkinella humicola]
MAEGLPNRIVMTIGQDHQGFAWIGTMNNAYRFDSHSFKALPPEQSARESSLASVVHAIRTDSERNLWFFKAWSSSDHEQIEILAPGQQKPTSFEAFFHRKLPFDADEMIEIGSQENGPRQSTDPILVPLRNGDIWRYEGKGHFKRLYHHTVSSNQLVSSSDKLINLHVTPTGTLLLVFSREPTRYPTSQIPFLNELVELWSNGTVRRRQAIPNRLFPVWVDRLGTIYLNNEKFFSPGNKAQDSPHLTEHQVDRLLYRLTEDGRLINVPISFPANPFPAPNQYKFTGKGCKMTYDARHQLFWIISKSVLFAWSPKHGIVFNLAASGFPVTSVDEFNQLFVDRTGAVWIGTNNGFFLMTVEPNPFQRHFYNSDQETATPNLSTRGIAQVGDWLWINANWPYFGTSQLLNLKTGQSPQVVLGTYGPVVRGHDQAIWAPATGHFLARVNPITLEIQKYPLTNPASLCWALWQDGRHNFWLGFDEGLSYFDNHRKRDQPFRKYNQYRELAKNRVNGFFPDSSAGGLWVAASSGLYLLDTLRGITARYSSQDPAPYHLPFDHLTFVHPDRSQPGIYWLATRGGGLIRWERQTGRWQQFTRETGLSNNEIYSIHEDRQGRLWLPSSYGLMRFQKKTHQTQVFLPQDGITHEEFNLASYFLAPDGQLFLGGLNGVTAFRPDRQMLEKPVVVPLMVTDYEQLNASTGQRTDHLADFNRDQQISIPTQNRSFSLTFALLDYRYGRQFRLSYRIVGWQNYWTSQLRRDVAINGLPPGQYQLQVRAQNPNGQWVSDTLTIPITVLTPFYQQPWFVILCLLSLLWVIVGIFRWRNERLIRETKRLEAEVTRRTAQIENDKALIQQQATDLQASATLKARFFANVSHEFRTPLTLLLGPLAYLSKRTTEPATARLLAGMDRNARQLLAMVSDLLDLSKLDVNPMQLTKQPADLCALINQTVSSFTPQAEYTGIHLTVTGTSKPVWLLLDVAKMETVLKNLLANALHFTPAGGSVTVRLFEPADWVHIEVSDTGSGIHPNDLPHIFERYYQSQQPDAPLRGGTGIGLALSMEYCKLWGGGLTVDSTLGKGSTFALTCPYQPTAPQETIPAPETKNPEPVLAEAKNHHLSTRILLVEDNPDMAEYLETILSPYYLLHVTRNGREAWQWLSALPVADQPNLIVTDLMMPDMDGLALVNQIRQQPTVRAIPVLMLTARTSQDVKLEALRLGVADYVTKPFDQDELITRIGNLLERSQERTAWQQQLPSETAGSPVPMDEEWLLQIEQLILKNLTNTQFQVHSIADAVHSSERQLYRRLKKLTGFSPNQFMQEIRLQTAREWLENQQYSTVKEVCYAVGFQDVVYFSRLFLNRFGRYPATFLRTADVS